MKRLREAARRLLAPRGAAVEHRKLAPTMAIQYGLAG